MRYLSVCSGIEAATVAWHDLGWQPAAFSEIEPFPSAVLKHHYPDVPNVGDMTKYKEWDIGTIDLLVGGTPCQSFSVAGLRKGLEDPRGNLALVYCGILDRFKPKWFVWENVPGVLSSSGGRDFGSFLGAVAELGYGFAYRVLDAQYFGVAQRRRRVFVVGCLGDWRSAAAVLFERESLSGNPAPSREKGQEITGTIAARFGISRNNHEECVATSSVDANGLQHTVGTLCADTHPGGYSGQDAYTGRLVPQSIALAENTIGRQPENGGNGDGFTVGGPMYTLNATGVHGVAQPIAFEPGKLKRLGYGDAPAGIAPTLRAGAGDNQLAVAQPIPLNSMNVFRSPNADPSTGCGVGEPGEAMFTLTKGNHHAVAQPMVLMDQGGSVMNVMQDGTVGTLRRETHGHEPVVMHPTAYAFDSLSSNSMKSSNPISGVNEVSVSKTLDTSRGLDPSCNQGGIGLVQSMAVRRLTPTECERLQGFPDNYTNIPWRKQPESPDGPRYKALGNSMAVPVMAWIGRRIANAS